MASTNVHQFDQIINDQNLLLEIGRYLENFSNYKNLTLIPEHHQIYGINNIKVW